MAFLPASRSLSRHSLNRGDDDADDRPASRDPRAASFAYFELWTPEDELQGESSSLPPRVPPRFSPPGPILVSPSALANRFTFPAPVVLDFYGLETLYPQQWSDFPTKQNIKDRDHYALTSSLVDYEDEHDPLGIIKEPIRQEERGKRLGRAAEREGGDTEGGREEG
jgi:hypothetical protein